MPTPIYPTAIVEGPTRRYLVNAIHCEGDLATLSDATYTDGNGTHNVIVKTTRDRADNDLVWNEAGILGFLYPPSQPEESLYTYFPRLIDAFEAKDGHRVNVFARIDGHLTVAEILRAYPSGIDFRDMCWMYKRVLSAIGFAHSKGVIHGAVIPPHVMVHPVRRGAKLLDWSYALNFAPLVVPKDPAPTPPTPVPHRAANAWERLLEDPVFDPDPAGSTPSGPPMDPNRMYVRAISVDWTDYYPPEIFVRATPSPATDIYMAAKIAVALLGGDVKTNQLPDAVPVQIRAFLQASLGADPRQRVQDAWDLPDRLDALVTQLVGRRRYREFKMPETLPHG